MVTVKLAAETQHLFAIGDKIIKTKKKKLPSFLFPLKIAKSDGEILSFLGAGVINFNPMCLGFENSETEVENLRKLVRVREVK